MNAAPLLPIFHRTLLAAVAYRIVRFRGQGSRVTASATMKILSARNVFMLSALLACVRFSDADGETLTVAEGGVAFTAIRYDDGRNTPFGLEFSQDGILSMYLFNLAGYVKNIEVDAETYEVRRYSTPTRSFVLSASPRVPSRYC